MINLIKQDVYVKNNDILDNLEKVQYLENHDQYQKLYDNVVSVGEYNRDGNLVR